MPQRLTTYNGRREVLPGEQHVDLKAPVVRGSVVRVYSRYALRTNDSLVLADAVNGQLVIDLFSPAQEHVGKQLWFIKKVDSTANAIVLLPRAGAKIDGSTYFAFTMQYESLSLTPDSQGDWWII